MPKKTYKSLEEYTDKQKKEILKRHGYYELAKQNNWVYCNKVPKNWKGKPLNDTFAEFYDKNKKIFKE
ncbi:MAG: hypothetical protein ACOCQ4_00645 [bacterium]